MNQPSPDPIEIVEETPIAAPKLPGDVVVANTPERLHERLGGELLVHALDSVNRFGSFHMALSGGGTPMPFYTRLMTDPNYRAMPWRRTHLWIVDERRAPFEDDASNYKHIHEIIVDHSDIPASQVHPILAMEPDAPAQYERALREALGQRDSGGEGGHDHGRHQGPARLDFVLLGMGDNGHTASLFPETAVLDERVRWVAPCEGPTVTPPPRVTMTYPLINAARFVAVLVVGANKAAMVSRVANGNDDFHALPIKGIRPRDGVLHWYLDRAACGDATPVDPGAHPGGPRTKAPPRGTPPAA